MVFGNSEVNRYEIFSLIFIIIYKNIILNFLVVKKYIKINIKYKYVSV